MVCLLFVFLVEIAIPPRGVLLASTRRLWLATMVGSVQIADAARQLEDSVQMLTAQLEDARRQLGQSGFNRLGQPLSPQSKDTSQLQAENVYLREENAELRRQVYGYRSSGYGHPPAPSAQDGDKDWAEVKQESSAGFGMPYAGPSSSLPSPRGGESSHSRGGLRTGGSAGGPSDYMGVSNGYDHYNYAYAPVSMSRLADGYGDGYGDGEGNGHSGAAAVAAAEGPAFDGWGRG